MAAHAGRIELQWFSLCMPFAIAVNFSPNLCFVVCGEGKVVKRIFEDCGGHDHLSENNDVTILAIAIKAKYVVMRRQAIFL